MNTPILSDIKVLDNLLALNLNVNLWSARKKMVLEDFGSAEIKAGGNATVEAAGTLTILAPQIVKKGNESGFGADGGTGEVTENVNRTTTGSLTVNGPLTVNGDLSVSGDSSIAGNSFAGSRSGGGI